MSRPAPLELEAWEGVMRALGGLERDGVLR